MALSSRELDRILSRLEPMARRKGIWRKPAYLELRLVLSFSNEDRTGVAIVTEPPADSQTIKTVCLLSLTFLDEGTEILVRFP
jgi:hypothetical protein